MDIIEETSSDSSILNHHTFTAFSPKEEVLNHTDFQFPSPGARLLVDSEFDSAPSDCPDIPSEANDQSLDRIHFGKNDTLTFESIFSSPNSSCITHRELSYIDTFENTTLHTLQDAENVSAYNLKGSSQNVVTYHDHV
jgi:hypothetical protein